MDDVDLSVGLQRPMNGEDLRPLPCCGAVSSAHDHTAECDQAPPAAVRRLQTVHAAGGDDASAPKAPGQGGGI